MFLRAGRAREHPNIRRNRIARPHHRNIIHRPGNAAGIRPVIRLEMHLKRPVFRRRYPGEQPRAPGRIAPAAHQIPIKPGIDPPRNRIPRLRAGRRKLNPAARRREKSLRFRTPRRYGPDHAPHIIVHPDIHRAPRQHPVHRQPNREPLNRAIRVHPHQGDHRRIRYPDIRLRLGIGRPRRRPRVALGHHPFPGVIQFVNRSLRQRIGALQRSPRGLKTNLKILQFQFPRQRIGFRPVRRRRRQIRQNLAPPLQNELPHPVSIFRRRIPNFRQRIVRHHRRQPVNISQQFRFIPNGTQQLLQTPGVFQPPFRVVIQPVGNGRQRQHRRRRIADVVENIGVILQMKNIIHPPGNEHKGPIRFPVKVIIVAVAGIAVPMPHQRLRSPKTQETIQIN